MAYEFHYTPTGTGVISGKEVLEQTEDAINDLGNTAISGVQEALDKAEQALTNSQNAVDDAQTALNTANNAEGVAIQAQTDVGNLSGTVTNIGNRVTTAEGNISNLQGRMTTAEGNITNLQGRMTTAEGNIGNLQTAVSTAQATANSAQQTATTARQQSYVFRYSSTALTPSSTNSNTLLDNTDNLKVGDKVIDSSGVLFSVTAIDTANSTFTIGTALIDLAQDSDVVHKSGNETISGDKVFNTRLIKNIDVVLGTAPSTGKYSNIDIADNNKASLLQILGGVYDTGNSYARFFVQNKTADDGTGLSPTGTIRSCGFNINLPASSTSEGQGSITPRGNKTTDFGLLSYQWRNLWCEKLFLNGTQLDPSAFVTTDTNQTISGNKTFSSINGVEPSSLSLPDYSRRIDISSYVTNLNGTYNAYTPSVNGWIAIQSSNATFIRIADTGSGGLGNTVTSQTAGVLTCMIPVRANRQNNIYIVCTTLTSAYFIPCQGNV